MTTANPVRAVARPTVAAPAATPVVVDPVARLYVDTPLAHLDRLFDYRVPAEFDDIVGTGSRVRVRFAGRLVDGWVLERRADTEHAGPLASIERVLGTEPVLTPVTARLFRAVADRWAGSFVDVVRLGVPPRHARAEAAARTDAARPEPPGLPDPSGWSGYETGAAYLSALGAGRPARAVWSARPGDDWAVRLAEAAQAVLAGGRGVVAVVPDARDLDRLDRAFTLTLGAGQHVALSAELGPSVRYRRWLAVRRGEVRAVIGTRSAAYAPVADLALVAVWDDGDDLHVEPRAPYPNVRDVLVLRSSQESAALLVGGFARTVEAALLVESGWAHDITAARTVVREWAPRVIATGGEIEQQRDPAADTARLPSLALRTVRSALEAGRPVLVQVPRSGYAPALACIRDRHLARCPTCAGPLALAGSGRVPTCRWCARPVADWACPVCGGRRLRAQVTGAARTGEELGRTFAGVPVRTSGGDAVLDVVAGGPALVVSTPGAEPCTEGGYGAALLLDGWAMLGRADLRAGEETLRRWLNASALVAADGTVVVAGADASVPAVQALVRWDPAGHAGRELAERRELGYPPVTRMAALRGPPAAIAELLEVAELPVGTDRIGPVPAGELQQVLLRTQRADGAALARALHAASAIRSARKAADPVRVQLDPAELG